MSEKFKKVLAKAQKNFDDMFGCSQCASLRAENEALKIANEQLREIENAELAEAREILEEFSGPNKMSETRDTLLRRFEAWREKAHGPNAVRLHRPARVHRGNRGRGK